MTSAELVTRANAIREKARLMESIPGSGLHDNDRNIARPDLFAAPQRNGLPRQSEHVVHFTDHFGEEMVFAGDDARRAFEALARWERRATKIDPAAHTGTERKLLTRILPRLKLEAGDAPEAPILRVRLDTWNDVLHALYEQGLGLSGAPLEE